MTKPTDDVIDIEAYAKEGKPVPAGRSYRIRIDKEQFTVTTPTISGRSLLELASKNPAKYGVYQHVRGRSSRVALDATVDLTAPGVERFSTLPLDQTEGQG